MPNKQNTPKEDWIARQARLAREEITTWPEWEREEVKRGVREYYKQVRARRMIDLGLDYRVVYSNFEN